MNTIKLSKKGKSSKFDIYLINIVIFFSVIAQITNSSVSVITRPMMYISWITLGFYLILRLNSSVKIKSFGYIYFISYGLFIFFSLIATLFGNDHLHAGITLPLTISIGAYFIGLFLRQINFSLENIRKCLIVFVACVLILGIQIRLNYFSSISSWMDQMSYGYPSKNSAGQLLVLSVIILLFYFDKTSKIYSFIRYVVSAYMLYVLVLIQCRSAIIALVITCIARIFIKKEKRKTYLISILGVGSILLLNQTTLNIIEKALFIGQYGSNDLNSFSSGRIYLWTEAFRYFSLNPFLGTGKYYVDNFYISILTENGIIGFLIIFSVFAIRLFINFRMKNNVQAGYVENNLYSLIKLFSVFYIVESFFEGFPPLGPGVCSFLFWLLCGYLDMQRNNKSISQSVSIDKNLTVKKRARIVW